MKKSPAVAYISHKLEITPKSKILAELNEAPISIQDRRFLLMILEGASYKDLALHFNKSEARIYQWKRKLYEKLCRFDSYNYTENSLP